MRLSTLSEWTGASICILLVGVGIAAAATAVQSAVRSGYRRLPALE